MKLISYTTLDALRKSSPKTKVKLYTMQHASALDAISDRGYMDGNHQHSMMFDDAPNNDVKIAQFAQAYEWMCEQMAKRVPNFSGDFPIWAWYHKPTLKQIRGGFSSARTLITIEVPLERCLFSDFDLWHSCLNNSYLSKDILAMENYFDNYEEYTQQQVMEHWDLIFDLTYDKRRKEYNKYMGLDPKGRDVQICVDRIYEQDIVSITIEDGSKV